MIEFTLKSEHIDLFQLLKATNLCGTGGEAKIMIDEGRVYVDGEVETRKRCKIRTGQTVAYCGEEIAVQSAE